MHIGQVSNLQVFCQVDIFVLFKSSTLYHVEMAERAYIRSLEAQFQYSRIDRQFFSNSFG
jgi:hypothetical protein